MAFMLNSVHVAGNLTRDPQVRFFANEKAVADFGLAINRRYRGGDGEMKEETTFIDVETWGRQAELVGQYLTKGRNCFVEGSLKLDQWEDKSGNKRSKIKVTAQRVHFLGPNDRSGGGESGGDGASRSSSYNESNAGAAPVAPSEPIDDEPPF
ncbi:MAG: single-stranded DNA-binding protein [Planctomycetes bacterium]|nr:single-stranded DNA-binding protein [Planctomycetota bacterium]